MRSLSNPKDRQEIEHRLAALTAEDQRRWGKMDVNAMLCHVREAFRTAMGELTIAPAPSPWSMPPAVLKLLALRTPLPWSQDLPTLAELRLGAPAMHGDSFAEERATVQSELGRFLDPDRRLGSHPYFGSMSRADWLRWGWLHTDHHLRQFGR